jgi:hypothetical protein
MKKIRFTNTIKFFQSLSIKDIFGLLVFLFIPLSFFVFDLTNQFRIIYYAVLVVFIAIYTFVGQFFFEEKKLSSLGKRLIALTVINTITVSFISFSGNLASPFFFILYFLLFFVAIYVPLEIVVIEGLIVSFSVLMAEAHTYSSISVMFSSLDSVRLVYLFSIPIMLPLVLAIAAFVKNLQKKQELLLLSKELLTIRDIEDEVLLKELNQGVIVLDSQLTIIKVSQWVEKNFSLVSKLILGKNITELEFYDPVSNRKLLTSDYFYKNLLGSNPQKLNWRVLFKNQYGKFRKFVITQAPLIVNTDRTLGFLLTVKDPPTSVDAVVGSFNKILSFRLSSSVLLLKNLLSISKQIKGDPVYPNIEKHFDSIIRLLNDTTIKDDIADGNYEINLKTFDLKTLVQKVIKDIDPVRKVAVWNISPLYKTSSIDIKSDELLCTQLLTYTIKGALYFSKDSSVNLTIDEDENLKRPRILLTVGLKEEFQKVVKILEPFFAGQITALSRYSGTGLEISNANLIAKFLGLDFNAGISNNKLVIKIVF